MVYGNLGLNTGFQRVKLTDGLAGWTIFIDPVEIMY